MATANKVLTWFRGYIFWSVRYVSVLSPCTGSYEMTSPGRHWVRSIFSRGARTPFSSDVFSPAAQPMGNKVVTGATFHFFMKVSFKTH